MIEKLGVGNKCIFDVELSDNKKYLIMTEACCMYYETTLTKDETIELANDFMRIAESMSNT
jgi:hypothetical protein